ncbi:MAG: hypothetical protein ICV82_05220 [Nitrososphaera sp.]|nr:hypothetical protein [Nitrososphaera sp.]MDQ5859775.1 hypothetical protein [Thermoproteota archaeon]
MGRKIPYAIAYRTILDEKVNCKSIVDFFFSVLNWSFWICIIKDPIPRPKKAMEIAINA